jgi:3-hydroxyacyl-CoA dehydrogenase/enoyl-CoA hydratase/carnithine racemase
MVDYSISDNICILRLNNPPLNAINFQLLDDLTESLKRANENEIVKGIIITGGGEHFSAGADVNIFEKMTSTEEALNTSRRFQGAFDAVESSLKPIAAALAGTVLGGALELAMACHFRVCAHSSRFGMSEVKLGINPGAGGTQRLPRIVGPEIAFKMLLTGRPINVEEALQCGLVDARCDKERLIEICRSLLAASSRPVAASRRTEKVSDMSANEKALLGAQTRMQSARPENIAPRQIIEAAAVGLRDSYAAGLCKEQEAFARCMQTPAARNLMHLFFATRKTGKSPGLEAIVPKTINRVAIIGMGTMGSGIAQAFASAGKSVTVLDSCAPNVEKAVHGIKASLERKIKRGAMTPAQAIDIQKRIIPVNAIADIGQTDLIVEAVFEDIAVKQALIDQINAVCSRETIVASNTSTIDLDALAERLVDPGRLVGLHFFNPAHSMPLVEVVRCKTTSPDILAAAMRCMKDIRKTPVLVKNSAGFAVNRVFIPYFMEAFKIFEEGGRPHEIDSAMLRFGFPMGPLATIDMTGIDILAMTDRQMQAAFPYHLPLPRIVRELVGQGLLGQKAGAGVYKYDKDATAPKENERADGLADRMRRASGEDARVVPPEEVTERLVLRLVGEAFRVIEEGIVDRESDLDVASALGAGFPDFRGGVLKYAYDQGIDSIKNRLDALSGRFGGRFKPCQYILNKMGV